MKNEKYSHAFGCYGMPLGVNVQIETDKALWKEGKRKRYCRVCLRAAVNQFRDTLINQLKKVGCK